MLETLIFQCSIAIAHKFDNFTNISKRLWDLVYVWSVLLSLKFQANTYSFERVVTLFVGYYFSSGHLVETGSASEEHLSVILSDDLNTICSIIYAKIILLLFGLRTSSEETYSSLLTVRAVCGRPLPRAGKNLGV